METVTVPDMLVYASILCLVIARDSYGPRREPMGFLTMLLAGTMAGWFGHVFLDVLPAGWVPMTRHALGMTGLALVVAALVPLLGIVKILRRGPDAETG